MPKAILNRYLNLLYMYFRLVAVSCCIVEEDRKKVLQVSIGLVAQILRTVTAEEHRSGFEKAGASRGGCEVGGIIERSSYDLSLVAEVCGVELLLTLMRSSQYIALFNDLGTQEALE
ncbi:hypothetical protein HPP92_006477 [Vanilla planifolia]|uniref:Uncharacterized protein n=1 Tax=Vanilla planifolia TaxID=51239 RepID=A0A835V757_VANPL|nr:hypothetical protein HPP92_006738 [Vanilla planifolia]KAG0489614.1 hypothetical protein HPP92_006477 [Vanilla planifolia]